MLSLVSTLVVLPEKLAFRHRLPYRYTSTECHESVTLDKWLVCTRTYSNRTRYFYVQYEYVVTVELPELETTSTGTRNVQSFVDNNIMYS
jgi:hypothetical protein